MRFKSVIRNQKSVISQQGQVVIILLMLLLVALSIGLAVTQKSLTDVTTSTQTEQSSRAFSAAEAGIEKALSNSAATGDSFALGNDATATIKSTTLIPTDANIAIEYPPIGRETIAQFWLTDPKGGSVVYNQPRFDIYFGNENTTDKPAVEVKIVMKSNNVYYTKTYYYDSDTTRSAAGAPNSNNFTPVYGCGSNTLASGILGDGHKFYCKQTVPAPGGNIPDLGAGGVAICPSGTCSLVLARVRFLYSADNQKLALAPDTGAQFPPQVQVYNSTGIAGLSQKQLQAFKVIDVVPGWFDFAVFSVNQISK